MQQETGDYAAAAASHQQALALFGDLGNLVGQAEALNRLGELATRTANTTQAREHHAQALAVARDIRAAPEEARALEGLGQAHLHDGSPGQAAGPLREALTIYQRIGAPAARRVQEIIQNHKLTSTNLESSQRLPINERQQTRTLAEPPRKPLGRRQEARALNPPGVPRKAWWAGTQNHLSERHSKTIVADRGCARSAATRAAATAVLTTLRDGRRV